MALVAVSSFGVSTRSFSIPAGYTFSCFSWSPSPFFFWPERGPSSSIGMNWGQILEPKNQTQTSMHFLLVRSSLNCKRQGFSHARKMMTMIGMSILSVGTVWCYKKIWVMDSPGAKTHENEPSHRSCGWACHIHNLASHGCQHLFSF